MRNLYRDIRARLIESGIPEGEAKAVTLLLMEKACGMTAIEALTNDPKGEKHRPKLMQYAQRIAAGEPVQYVLGEADFCGMSIKVRPGVLIPRKETEELVNWIVESLHSNCQLSTVNCQLLDIGTGSGCIAVALAKKLERAEVEAWDVSEEALLVAKENAERNGVEIRVKKVDVLLMDNGQRTTDNYYDVMVSNPPYICEEESKEMERNVLEHEPRIALLFYRRIGELGLQKLRGGGALFFEINRRFGSEVVQLLQGMNYQKVDIRQDIFGNDRMVKAIKPL